MFSSQAPLQAIPAAPSIRHPRLFAKMASKVVEPTKNTITNCTSNNHKNHTLLHVYNICIKLEHIVLNTISVLKNKR